MRNIVRLWQPRNVFDAAIERIVRLALRTPTKGTKFTLALVATFISVGLLDERALGCELAICVALPLSEAALTWSILWGLYAAVKWWRLFTERPNTILAFAVNFCGMLVYGGWTAVLLEARGFAWFATGPEMGLTLAAVWVFVRTSIPGGERWDDVD